MNKKNNNKEQKTSIVLLSVPELLEASIIDNAKYYSQQYLKDVDIFSLNDNMKATKKKSFMSKWITKIQYNTFKSCKANNMKLQKPLCADDLYKEIYPKNIKLHKMKILCFLDPNTYNKNTTHNIKIPAMYDDKIHKFGDTHITYLPATKQKKDAYHTSCDYNGYHFTYKLYDYVNLQKHNGIQYIAETYFYKQKINHSHNSKKCKRYSKKQILDLKSNANDHYIAFLLSFVWNLFYTFDLSCVSDGQIRKSVKFKICKKMAQILNKNHFIGNKQNINQKYKNKNHTYANWNKQYKLQQKHSKKNYNENENEMHMNNNYLSHYPLTRPNNYNPSQYYNNGPLKMEKW